MKNNQRTLIILALISLLVSACGAPRQSREDELATAIAQTVAAVEAQQPTQAPPQPTNTAAPLPTLPPQPTKTPYNPTATPRPCNFAVFVSENPEDGVSFKPGESFTKTWRLKNSGTCTWNTDYRVVYYSGDDFDGVHNSHLANHVKPGEVMDVSYTFTAPDEPGTYETVFKIQDDDGHNFGQFWVNFKVKAPNFAVTGVNLQAEHSVISGACPQTFDYEATIKTSGAGTVTYYLKFSDGSQSSTKSLSFSSAGSKTISGSWELDSTGDYWIKLYVDEPNHQWFGPLELSLTCTP